MKSLILSVWLILFGVFLLPEGVTVAQPTIRFEIIPDKTFYRAGETITLEVQADAGVQVRAIITHLTEDVTELNADLVDGRVLLTWTAPEPALRAYGVDAELLDADGSVLSSTSTAFDVLERWTQAPRYGFLSDFGAAITPKPPHGFAVITSTACNSTIGSTVGKISSRIRPCLKMDWAVRSLWRRSTD
jgi:hypothetical protein